MKKSYFSISCVLAAVGLCLIMSARLDAALGQEVASVSGRVTVNGKAVVGAVVSAKSQEDILSLVQSRGALLATTDAEGRYRITGLAPHPYYVSPEVPGYVVPSDSGLVPFIQGRRVFVKGGEDAQDIDFELSRGGVLSGRVRDQDGHPIIAGRLILQVRSPDGKMRLINQLNPRMGMTDDRGIYRIYGLPAGQYILSIEDEREESVPLSAGGGAMAKTYYPGVADQRQATVIDLKVGTEIENLDFELASERLAESFTISGQTLDAETGDPIPLIELVALAGDEKAGSSGGIVSVLRSDNEGEFRLGGLHNGTYQIAGNPALGGEAFCEPAAFEITGSDISGLIVKVRKGARIIGKAILKGNADAVALSSLDGITLATVFSGPSATALSGLRRTRIARDGSFEFTGLPAGKARIEMGMVLGAKKGVRILRVERDGVDESQGMEIGPGEQINGVRVILVYASGIIQGQVKLEGGSLRRGCELFVSARESGSVSSQIVASSQVDARGRFTVGGLPDGLYELEVRTLPLPGFSTICGLRAARRNVLVAQGVAEEVLLVFNLREQRR